ncbi:hypothetical protein A4H97_13280 [Niastella yeongjuensis]|uniref:Uncharacterized protein n=1 Tax=Niastella yeongjuensis TaxID=354355 RepID=A0A1V9EAJ2_9BACT|nr:hypothetical protein A4H97_13280 [Niastella yeongjuensis]
MLRRSGAKLNKIFFNKTDLHPPYQKHVLSRNCLTIHRVRLIFFNGKGGPLNYLYRLINP